MDETPERSEGALRAPGSGDLERLTRKMQVTAYVSGGLTVFSILSIFVPASAAGFFVLLFYPAMFVLLVSSVGTVVGQLLLAARRDEQRAGASQNRHT